MQWGSGGFFVLFCGAGERRIDDVGVTSELSLKQVLVAHARNFSPCVKAGRSGSPRASW